MPASKQHTETENATCKKKVQHKHEMHFMHDKLYEREAGGGPMRVGGERANASFV
jgi:hypothetical protein